MNNIIQTTLVVIGIKDLAKKRKWGMTDTAIKYKRVSNTKFVILIARAGIASYKEEFYKERKATKNAKDIDVAKYDRWLLEHILGIIRYPEVEIRFSTGKDINTCEGNKEIIYVIKDNMIYG